MALTTRIASIPQIYRNVNRWREILAILSKYGLADWISRFDLSFAKDLFRGQDERALARQSGERRIRMALEELGPTAIKLGQVLSTRPDVIGLELARELERLQRSAPPTSTAEVRARIESELGMPIAEIFPEFDDEPLASASIGQAHRARLREGHEVVVKVRHPGVVRSIRVDLDILVGLAQLAERIPELQLYRPASIAAEFQRTLLREVNFGSEERHLQEFGTLFSDDPRVKIPSVYPQYSTARVLTMDRIAGTPLGQRDAIVAAGLDPEEIARHGAELYVEMIFEHGVYHADPHPGNIMLLDGNTIGLIDFGMVGRIDERLREDLEEMVHAIATGDTEMLVTLIARVGDTPAELDRAGLGVDVDEFVAHYGSQPFEHFALGAALRDFTQIVRRHAIVLPSRASMLIKVLVMLEGTSRQLSPSFNLLEAIRPYHSRLVMRRLSPLRQARKLRRIYVEFEQLAQVLPRNLIQILGQIQSGKFDMHLDHRGLEPSVNRLVFGLLTSALFVGSSFMLALAVPPVVRGLSVLGAAGVGVSVVLGLRLLRAIHKSGTLERRP